MCVRGGSLHATVNIRPHRGPTTRSADWSVQVTLSIAEEAVNSGPLSKVIWIEL